MRLRDEDATRLEQVKQRYGLASDSEAVRISLKLALEAKLEVPAR